MNITIELPKDELKAMVPFVTRDETRIPIHGILVELRKNKRPLLVTTDGRRLAVLKSEATTYEGEATQFTLPMPLLEKALSWTSSKTVFARFTVDDKNITTEFLRGGLGVRLTYPKCSLPYPKWREVVPRNIKESPNRSFVAFNPDYVKDYAKVAKALRSQNHVVVTLLLGTDPLTDPMVIRIEGIPEFYAVLMPCRINGDPSAEPDEWLEMAEGDVKPEPPKPQPQPEVKP